MSAVTTLVFRDKKGNIVATVKYDDKDNSWYVEK